MSNRDLVAIAEGDETKSSCPCCKQNIRQGFGSLEWQATPTADYWYSWSDGHAGEFYVAVRWGNEGAERIVIASCSCDPAGTQLSIVDHEHLPWPKLDSLGRVLTRSEAKKNLDYPDYFELFDAVIETDSRLALRVEGIEKHV